MADPFGLNLDDIVRQGVSLADDLTGSLQGTIGFYAWTGYGIYGEPVYASPISMQAIIEEKESRQRKGDSEGENAGQEIRQKAQVTILRPVAANGAADRREPIDPRDKIVLPNGYTGPILHVDGVSDPETLNPYMYVVVLG